MEKQILFNTEMVKAILEGRKTTTRRIIKDVDGLDFIGVGIEPKEIKNTVAFGQGNFEDIVNAKVEKHVKAPYLPEDILYVRETWQESECFDYSIKDNYVYKANVKDEEFAKEHNVKWRPSIHMPKEATRIFLKVKDVRVERLQDIDYDNLLSEGTEIPRFATEEALQVNFKNLWDSTLKKEQLKTYGWDADPWVWVIQFEVMQNV